MPGSHSGIICKHEEWIQAVCQGYRDLEQKQRNDVTSVGTLLHITDKAVLVILVVYSRNKCSLSNIQYMGLTFWA